MYLFNTNLCFKWMLKTQSWVYNHTQQGHNSNSSSSELHS